MVGGAMKKPTCKTCRFFDPIYLDGGNVKSGFYSGHCRRLSPRAEGEMHVHLINLARAKLLIELSEAPGYDSETWMTADEALGDGFDSMFAKWPRVDHADWCGEHRATVEAQDDDVVRMMLLAAAKDMLKGDADDLC